MLGVALVCENIRRNFGGVRALKGVSVAFEYGAVHGLVGANGAGKSTLLGVLSGKVVPSAGRVTDSEGRHLRFGDPIASRAMGIGIVHQELTTLASRTALENVFLGCLRSKWGVVCKREMLARFVELSEIVGVDIDPSARCGSLSISDQQALEIMRALDGDRRVLILDEPTAALAAEQRRHLFKAVERIASAGTAVILVTHNLDEVLAECDTISVMRNGELVQSRPAARWTKEGLVEAMLTRDLASTERSMPARRSFAGEGTPLLSVEGLSVGRVRDASFSVFPGEILGIGGLVGSGRSSLLRALSGSGGRVGCGRLVVRGEAVRIPSTPSEAIRLGIMMVPEDRKDQGLVLSMSCLDNASFASWRQLSEAGIIRRARQRAATRKYLEAVGFVQFDRLNLRVGQLSGGNQQKIVLAKWLCRNPSILLCDEPTRGIDVGAKGEILTFLRGLADGGLSVIFVSSELEEVVSVSDRVLVMANGEIIGELSDREISEANILRVAFGKGAGLATSTGEVQ